jgi:hypothetical protein
MATTARIKRTGQPDTTRAVPQVPQGAKLRAVRKEAQVGPYLANQYGNNTIPTDILNAPLSIQQAPTTFLPGDPVRATPGLDDGQAGPRTWSYPVGTNINPLPRQTEFIPFEMLRGLARNFYGIGLCLEVHNRIIQRLEPQFQPRDGIVPPDEDPTDPKWTRPAMLMNEWLMDGPNVGHDGRDLHGWLSALHRDLMEIDAAAIYHVQTKAGWLDGLRLIAADTIQTLYDTTGERPQPPYAAFRQVLYGAPAKALTTDNLDYLMFNPRSDSPYGISPVERMLISVNVALRKQDWDLRRFTDGATPAGLLLNNNTNSTNWTPEQVRLFERQFNEILAGNTALRVRTKVLPPGWTFQQNQMEAIDSTFDRYLLNIAAAMFGLTMDELAFTETSNRSVGDSQEAVTYRNAIKPRSDYLARYITRIAHRYDGTPLLSHAPTVSRRNAPTKSRGEWDARYKLTWGGIEEPDDFATKAQAVQGLMTSGVLTRLQAKRVLKLPIDQGEQDTPPFTVFNGGMSAVIPLQDIDGSRKAIMAQLQAQSQSAQVGVQTAQAGLKIQQDQGKMLDNQVSQAAQQQQSPDQSDQGGDEGEGQPPPDDGSQGPDNGPTGTPPTPPAPKGSKGKASAAPSADTSGDDEGENTDQGDTGAGNDAAAEAEVDALIAQAKAKAAAKGKKTQRAQAVDDVYLPMPPIAEDTASEWRRYREFALNRVKRGLAITPFTSDVLPTHLHTYAADALQRATTPDAVRAVFAEIRDAETHPTDCRCMVCGCGEPGNDHGMPYPVIIPGDTENEGCMVAFFLPASLSQQLAIPGGMPQQDMHITLAMLAKDITETPVNKARLLAAVQQWATTQTPIQVDLDHLTRFDGDTETYPVVVRSYTQALMDLRADLVAALDNAGIAIDTTYPDYKPHATLCYLPQGSPLPAVPEPNVHGNLSQVWVAYGDERYAYPLGGNDDTANMAETPVNDAVVQELRAMRTDVLALLGSEVVQPPFPLAVQQADEQRWAEHEIVRGAGGKIIGNIYDGVFHPVSGMPHAEIRAALPHVDPTFHRAVASYLGNHPQNMAEQANYWQDKQHLTTLLRQVDPLEKMIDAAKREVSFHTWNAQVSAHGQSQLDAANRNLAELLSLQKELAEEIHNTQSRLQASPVAASIHLLPPTVIHERADTQQTIQATFGRALSDQEVASLVGAQHGDLVTVTTIGGGSALQLHLYQPDGLYEAQRTVERDPTTGQIALDNSAFQVRDTGQGLGTRVFIDQVRSAAALGVATILTVGGKGNVTTDLGVMTNANGYYTWPRLGYTGSLMADFADKASQALGYRVTTVMDLMQTPEGRDYWRANGYQTDLYFDLRPDSPSRQILAAYAAAKGLDTTGVQRMQQPDDPQTPPWVDLDWTEADEAAADAAWANVFPPKDASAETPATEE